MRTNATRAAVVLALALSVWTAPLGTVTTAAAAAECSRAPSVDPDRATAHLEDDAAAWGGFCDNGTVQWDVQNVSSPSVDGRSLLCQLQAATPFAGLHCYRQFTAERDAMWFQLSLQFRFHPPTSCNDAGSSSVPQALEFAINKWQGGVRYELALQWENVNQTAGDGAPQWRWWDRTRPVTQQWVPLSPAIGQCLAADRWYPLTLRGHIAGGLIRYDSFSVDGVEHVMNVIGHPVSEPDEHDRLAVAVQANANSAGTPYDLYVDDVTFQRGAVTNITGFTWYGDGGFEKSGTSGSTVSAFATSARANRSYQLVSALGTGDYACSIDPIFVNPNTRVSNSRGFIATTSGTINRPPGTYQLCFYETTPGIDVRQVGLPVSFTVT